MNPLNRLFTSLGRMPPALMLVILLGFAALAAVMVTNYMSSSQRQLETERAEWLRKQSESMTVVKAAKDIAEGATISTDDLKEEQVQKAQAPLDAFSASQMAVGRIAKYTIPTGQIVSSHDLATAGGPKIEAGFESRIKEGYRAVTFAVDPSTGVAGFVVPGSHVDIVAAVGSGASTKVGPILSDVEVIAVGTTTVKPQGGGNITPSTVTVAVLPNDANKLIKAVSAAGKIYLTLRGGNDTKPVPIADVSSMFEKKELAESTELPPPPMPGAGAPLSPSTYDIEVWSGDKKETVSVPKN